MNKKEAASLLREALSSRFERADEGSILTDAEEDGIEQAFKEAANVEFSQLIEWRLLTQMPTCMPALKLNIAEVNSALENN